MTPSDLPHSLKSIAPESDWHLWTAFYHLPARLQADVRRLIWDVVVGVYRRDGSDVPESVRCPDAQRARRRGTYR